MDDATNPNEATDPDESISATDSNDNESTPQSTEPTSSADQSRTAFPSRRRFLALSGAAALGVAGLGASNVLGGNQGTKETYTVRLENVSDGMTLATSADGEAAEQPVPLSPGVFAVHTKDEPIFSHGEPERMNGLEEVAEDGMPKKLKRSVTDRETVVDCGVFNTPVGADEPSPLGPGAAYEFEFDVERRDPSLYLSLVTMFVPSNDLFYALGGASGLRLSGMRGKGNGNEMGNGSGNGSGKEMNGSATAGNVTDHVALWDTGTEINEEPGVGENQAQRQRAGGVGLVERGTVAPISEVNGYDYPAVEDVLKLMIRPQ